MLKYAERFYQRQLMTRKITNHQVLNQVEEIAIPSVVPPFGMGPAHFLPYDKWMLLYVLYL